MALPVIARAGRGVLVVGQDGAVGVHLDVPVAQQALVRAEVEDEGSVEGVYGQRRGRQPSRGGRCCCVRCCRGVDRGEFIITQVFQQVEPRWTAIVRLGTSCDDKGGDEPQAQHERLHVACPHKKRLTVAGAAQITCVLTQAGV